MYIDLPKRLIDVFHKIRCVFYISYSFNPWKYVKVYMKRPHSSGNLQESNSHIGDVRMIDWLLLLHFINTKVKLSVFIGTVQYFPSYCTIIKLNRVAWKPACNKRNTTLRCRTKKCITLSLVKPGELTLRVCSPGLTSFVQYTSLFCTFV